MPINARSRYTRLVLSAFGVSLAAALALLLFARRTEQPQSRAPVSTHSPVIYVVPSAPPRFTSPPIVRTTPVPTTASSPSARATVRAVPSGIAPAGTPLPPALQAGSGQPVATPATVAPLKAQPAVPPQVPMEAPDAYPRIVAVTLSSPVVSGGDTVTSSVETSSNVASVEARIGGYSANFQKTGVGRFTLQYKVPHLPFFLHKAYVIQIIARNTAGVAVSTAVAITVR